MCTPYIFSTHTIIANDKSPADRLKGVMQLRPASALINVIGDNAAHVMSERSDKHDKRIHRTYQRGKFPNRPNGGDF